MFLCLGCAFMGFLSMLSKEFTWEWIIQRVSLSVTVWKSDRQRVTKWMANKVRFSVCSFLMESHWCYCDWRIVCLAVVVGWTLPIVVIWGGFVPGGGWVAGVNLDVFTLKFKKNNVIWTVLMTSYLQFFGPDMSKKLKRLPLQVLDICQMFRWC